MTQQPGWTSGVPLLAKPSWFGYFGVLGFSEATVQSAGLFRIVGGAEMALGLVAFVLPVPAVLLCLAVWKIFTEMLRPLAGEPFWEFVERASNMVAPLALLYVRSPRSFTSWFYVAGALDGVHRVRSAGRVRQTLDLRAVLAGRAVRLDSRPE